MKAFLIRGYSPLSILFKNEQLNPYALKIKDSLSTYPVEFIPQYSKFKLNPEKSTLDECFEVNPHLQKWSTHFLLGWSIVLVAYLYSINIWHYMRLIFAPVFTILILMLHYLSSHSMPFVQVYDSFYQIQAPESPKLLNLIKRTRKMGYFNILATYGISYDDFIHEILMSEKYSKILWEYMQSDDTSDNILKPFYAHLSDIAQRVIINHTNTRSKHEDIQKCLKNLSMAFLQETESMHPIFEKTYQYVESLDNRESEQFYARLLPCYWEQITHRDFDKLQTNLNSIIQTKQLEY